MKKLTCVSALAGFMSGERNEYERVTNLNRKQRVPMERRWLNAKFTKPMQSL